ncbi:MAG: hypothetical protein Q6L50_10075 [Gloeomargarita sp. GMQP_bins_120]
MKPLSFAGCFALGSLLVLAQQSSPDILADLNNAWNNFIESGQWVALLVGLVLGYLLRMFTSY